jgi:prepilin-type N-terminal cleavage/methylation domain-containing protein
MPSSKPHRDGGSARGRQAGFTLLEVLTVLFVIGLSAAAIGPRLPVLRDRLDYALKRESVEETIGSLSYRALRDNRDLVISGSFDETGPVATEKSGSGEPPDRAAPIAAPLPGAELAALPPIAATAPKLEIPQGWRVVAPEPIYVFANGYCTGGKLDVVVGSATFRYALKAPDCVASAE